MLNRASRSGWLVVLLVVAAGCSTAPYEALSGETDLTGAYVVAFETACDTDCGVGRTVYLASNVSDPGVIGAIQDAVSAVVIPVKSPIAVRDRQIGDVAVLVFTLEEASLEGQIATVRIGHSEVTDDFSSYVGNDYLVSLRIEGGWVLRIPDDAGITVTT